MYFGIELTAPKVYSQVPDGEAKIRTKQAVATTNRKLLLGLLIIALAILFAVVVAGSEAGADLVPGRVDSAGAASGKNVPLVDEYPSLQPWINTSPYAHEPISISAGSAGMNLYE